MGSKRFLSLGGGIRRNFRLLRGLLIRESPKVVLRVLCSKVSQLLGSGSANFLCLALLHDGFLGSWKLEEFRTRP